jgi:putative ABC transport system permease protein
VILWRKAVRDLRAMGVRAAMVVLVIGVGAGAAAGIALALHDIRATRTEFYRRYALADLDLRLTRPVPQARLLARARDAGATSAVARLIVDGSAEVGGEQTAAELLGSPPDAPLDRLAIVAGRGLRADAPAGAVLEADYAHRRHLHPGDRLRLLVAGRALTVSIRGLARSPEYLLATANPDYLVPEPGSLAVVFLPTGGLERLSNTAGANDLAMNFPRGTPDLSLRALTAGLPVARLTPRSEQYSLRFTDADLHSFSLFAPVMGLVFAAVGLVLIALTLRRLVHAQRRELGALIALGYTPRTVVLTVLAPALALALAGALLAAAVSVVVGALVADEYARAIGFPQTSHSLAVAPLTLAGGLALAATLAAAAVPAAMLARLRPSDALRGESAASFRLPGWLTRASALGGTASAYATRNLVRRPARTAATVLSLAAAIGLGGALEVLLTSTNDSVDAAFAGERWDYAADLTTPLAAGQAVQLARRDGAWQAEPIVQGSARVTATGGRSADVELVGLPAQPALRHLTLTAGKPPAPDGIVLSEQTAADLHVHPGASLELAAPAGVERVHVAGVARTLAGTQVYLPAGQASALLGLSGRATSVLVRGDASVARRLRGDRHVGRVTARGDATKGERQLTSEFTGLIDLLLAISLAVGAAFLVASLALSHLDREGELATLRALGLGRRHIAAIIAGEALAQTAVAGALSVPAALLIAWPLQRRIAQAWFHITLSSHAHDFLIVIIPGLALALLAAAQATRRALRIDIARTVRARLIG